MEQDRRLELIDQAIQKHIHNKSDNNNNHNLKDHETEYQQTLSHLVSVSQVFYNSCLLSQTQHFMFILLVNAVYLYVNMPYVVSQIEHVLCLFCSI